MERPDPAVNRLLAALPADELTHLQPHLQPRRFESRDPVYEAGEPVPWVIFPLNGVFSLVSTLPDERPVEIATVGREGFVGLPVFLRATLTSAHRAFAQVPGDALVMDVGDFLGATANGAFQRALQRYTQALLTQIAQGAACNRLHTVDERAARWLLMTHDRVGADEFPLTQEFLAQMLGVRRQSANLAERALAEAGLISYSRGRVTVLDRGGLQDASCACYEVIAGEFERLLGP
jgi:CRP-like cAMP-binding protein